MTALVAKARPLRYGPRMRDRRSGGLIVGVLAALAPLAGCYAALDSVRERAANEFGCPQNDVAIKELGALSYKVQACGHEATYVCQAAKSQAPIACVREGGDNAAKAAVLTPPQASPPPPPPPPAPKP